MQNKITNHGTKRQPLASTMCTIFNCKAIESVMLCLHILINMCWDSLAWSLTNNIVVLLTRAEQTFYTYVAFELLYNYYRWYQKILNIKY